MAGYNKLLMATKVHGNVTFGYFMAFAEFLMGWIMAAVYMVRMRSLDCLAAQATLQSGGHP